MARLASLNPLYDIPNRKDVLLWGLFETANHSFTLLILTLLFPIYFQQVVVGDERTGKLYWGLTYALSSLIIVVVAPIVGAIADARGLKRPLLACTALGCILSTASLALVGPGLALLTVALFIPGNVAFVLGENLIAAYLPQLSTARTVGRISAMGWAMGYLGGTAVMLVAMVMMYTMELKEPARWPPLFLMAAAWFLVMCIPSLLFLKDRDPPSDPQGRANLLTIGFRRVAGTLGQRRRFRQLFRFLGVFFLYMAVVQTIIAFAGTIADQHGFRGVKLMFFMLLLTVTTCIGAVGTGIFQDRLGHRRTITLALGVWTLATLGLASLSLWPGQGHAPDWFVWLIGNGLGIAMGMIGTSSRAMVGTMTPRQKTAEFFGLWGLTLKASGAVGPAVYAGVSYVLGDAAGSGLLAGLCVLSSVLLLFVDEREGHAAAERAEREGAGPRCPGCASALAGLAELATCPECGAPLAPARPIAGAHSALVEGPAR